MMINYLFYRFSRIKVYKPIYWAKIFVTVLTAVTFLPACLTLSKYFWGCYDNEANDGSIKFVILGSAVLMMMVINFYYSPDRVKKLSEKYSQESKLWGNLRLLFTLILLSIAFIFGSTIIRQIVQIPEFRFLHGENE